MLQKPPQQGKEGPHFWPEISVPLSFHIPRLSEHLVLVCCHRPPEHMKLFHSSLSLSTNFSNTKIPYETLQYKEKATQRIWNTTPKTCRGLGREMERHTPCYSHMSCDVKDNWRKNWGEALWKMMGVSETARASKKGKKGEYDNERGAKEATCPAVLASVWAGTASWRWRVHIRAEVYIMQKHTASVFRPTGGVGACHQCLEEMFPLNRMIVFDVTGMWQLHVWNSTGLGGSGEGWYSELSADRVCADKRRWSCL